MVDKARNHIQILYSLLIKEKQYIRKNKKNDNRNDKGNNPEREN